MKLADTYKFIIFALIIFLTFLIVEYQEAKNYKFLKKEAIPKNPDLENQKNLFGLSEYKQVSFSYAIVQPSSGNPSSCCASLIELDKFAQALIKGEKRIHYSKGKWYRQSLSFKKNDYLLLVWYKIKQDEYGWIVIKSTSSLWYTLRNHGQREWIPNGKQRKYTWNNKGIQIDIKILNPANKKGWTGDDILYNFEYSLKSNI